jgi:ABC-type multidrug transport system fused ATPase/permease subunit
MLLIAQAKRIIKTTQGWPPNPIWMRKFGPFILLTLALPVLVAARRVLIQQFGGNANNAKISDFVQKELKRRLDSLREIIQEEKERDERKATKEKAKANGQDIDNTASPTSSVVDEEEEGDDFEDRSDSDIFVGEYDTDDEEEDGRTRGHQDTPLKVNDIVSAVNAVTQLDRYAPEVAEGWCLSAKAMARELPEAVMKTRIGEDEEWRNGDKLRSLWMRSSRLELILDNKSRGLWKRITDPFGGISAAYIKNDIIKNRFHEAAESFREAQKDAENLLYQRENTQFGKAMRLLWQYKKEIPWMALSTIFVMIEGAICAFPQHYQAQLISVIHERALGYVKKNRAPTNTIVDVLSSLLVSHCLSTLISLLAEKISSMTNRRIGLKMQVDTYHSILQQDIEYWDVHDTDEAFDTLWSSSECVDDIMRFPNDILQTLSNILSTSYILYKKNSKLLYIMMLLSPAQMIVQHYLGGLDYYVSRRAWKKNINSRSDWGEVLDPKNFRTVRSFVREPREVQMFARELELETETKATTAALRSLFEPVQSIVSQSSELLGLYYGGQMVVNQTLKAGDLISFIQTAQNLSYTLRQLMYFKDEFYSTLEPAARVYDLLSHKPKIGLYGGIKPNEKNIQGNLIFENVSFSYPSRPDVKVLRGASFSVNGGTTCALVGPSGSGKSTILSLVERFYDPSEGSITLDGINIKDLDPCWLRSQMAIVSQEPVLFSVSIRENLIYGCKLNHFQN